MSAMRCCVRSLPASERARAARPHRVVDEDVDAPRREHDLLERGVDRGGVGHVERQHGAARGGEAAAGGQPAARGREHGAAAARKLERERVADAAWCRDGVGAPVGTGTGVVEFVPRGLPRAGDAAAAAARRSPQAPPAPHPSSSP